MAIPYFPMYAGDWLSDPNVSALNFEEQGVFFHLMCRMWQNNDCRLPDDDVKISRILKINFGKWMKIKAALADVLTYSDGCFYSNRLLAEYEIAKKKSGVNSRIAKNREEVKRQKLLNNNDVDSTNVARTNHHKDKDKDKEESKIKPLALKPRKPRPPSGDQQTFIAWFMFAYEKVTGSKYILANGKDSKAVSEILKATSLKDAIARAAMLFISEDAFFKDKPKDITFFRSQVNKVLPVAGEHIEHVRQLGIAPPKGTKFEDWKFWETPE